MPNQVEQWIIIFHYKRFANKSNIGQIIQSTPWTKRAHIFHQLPQFAAILRSPNRSSPGWFGVCNCRNLSRCAVVVVVVSWLAHFSFNHFDFCFLSRRIKCSKTPLRSRANKLSVPFVSGNLCEIYVSSQQKGTPTAPGKRRWRRPFSVSIVVSFHLLNSWMTFAVTIYGVVAVGRSGVARHTILTGGRFVKNDTCFKVWLFVEMGWDGGSTPSFTI